MGKKAVIVVDTGFSLFDQKLGWDNKDDYWVLRMQIRIGFMRMGSFMEAWSTL